MRAGTGSADPEAGRDPGGSEPTDAYRPPRRRSGWLLAGAALTTVLLTTAAQTLLAGRLRTPQQVAADAAPPSPSAVTVPAEQRVLAEPVVLRGQVRPGGSVRLLPPPVSVGEASVVTEVPLEVGAELGDGTLVLVRSGEPMFTFVLPFPLWRDLTAGTRGPDVVAVQQALGRAGYPVPVTGEFDSATQWAISELYQRSGFAPPIVGAGTGATDPAARAAGDDSPGLPRTSVVRLDRPGRKVTRITVPVGTVLTDPETPLMELDGEPDYLAAMVGVDRAHLVAVGQRAEVHDDVLGMSAAAEVTEVGGEPVTDSSGQYGREVRFRFVGDALSTGDGRSLRIEISAAATRMAVLAVPVTAVYARPDGGTFVTVVEPDGVRRDVEVTAGATAGGWVAVRGVRQPLRPGDPVLVGGA